MQQHFLQWLETSVLYYRSSYVLIYAKILNQKQGGLLFNRQIWKVNTWIRANIPIIFSGSEVKIYKRTLHKCFENLNISLSKHSSLLSIFGSIFVIINPYDSSSICSHIWIKFHYSFLITNHQRSLFSFLSFLYILHATLRYSVSISVPK